MKSLHQVIVVGFFVATGLLAAVRWLHPATVSVTVFSIMFGASWLLLAIFASNSHEE